MMITFNNILIGTNSASYRKSFPGFCHYRRHQPPPNCLSNGCHVQDASIKGCQIQILWGQSVRRHYHPSQWSYCTLFSQQGCDVSHLVLQTQWFSVWKN